MKKKVVSLLIAGLMMLEPCTMADAADLSDTEVIEQSVESAGDSVETEAMGRLQRRQEILQNPGHRSCSGYAGWAFYAAVGSIRHYQGKSQ